MDNEQYEEDQYFQYLLEVGAFEIEGVSDDGDLMFKPNPEKMQEYAPEMFEMMQSDVMDALLDLYKKGLVEMEYDESLEPRFRLSDQAKVEMRKNGFYHLDNPDQK